MNPSHDPDSPDFVSKTQRKREMDALQDIGKALTDYAPARLEKVPMSDALRDALVEMHRLTKHEARRRQLQYIGRLMRNEEIGPIRAALEVLSGHSRAETARMHRLESLRGKLMDDEQSLTAIGDQFPGLDLQRLRQLRRNAIKEQIENRPPRAYREIYRMLREAEEEVTGSDSAGGQD